MEFTQIQDRGERGSRADLLHELKQSNFRHIAFIIAEKKVNPMGALFRKWKNTELTSL